MKHWILAAATILLIQGVDAREHWGPPPLCPQPKVDCCPKPKCPPKPCPPPCPPKECKPKPCPTNECCPKPDPCKPCCPPVCFERGLPTKPCCTPSAYSEPAAIDLDCGWDVFLTASFTYWQAIQGGMELALPGQATTIVPLAGVTQPALGHSVLVQDFQYKPGFQVGIGWSGAQDDWLFYGEYTWVRGTTHTSADAPTPDVASINGVPVGPFGVWIPTSWLPGVYPSNNVSTTLSASWNYQLDIADVQMSRPFYSGARFVLEPTFGIRGLWIRQSMDIDVDVIGPTIVALPGASRSAHYHSKSWAVGPRVGLNGNWHLGWGLRFIGDASASLLYTRYTKVSQNVDSPDAAALPVRMKLDDFGALRPNLDLSAGFGWGSYFFCRKMYWDLSATYDFNIFWEQNMMRHLADLTADITAHPDGAASNLFLQGLTIKTAFEF